MDKKELTLQVIERLKKEYPEAKCTLDYDKAWQLLVSVRLAAQCILSRRWQKRRRRRSRRSCGPAGLDPAKRGTSPPV